MSVQLQSLYDEIDRLKADLAYEKAMYESLSEVHEASKRDWYALMELVRELTRYRFLVKSMKGGSGDGNEV